MMRVEEILNAVNDFVSGYVLIALLIVAAVVFTVRTGFVQFRSVGEMLRLLVHSGKNADKMPGDYKGKNVSSFQAFMISIASRVGTGNLAGVATAIVFGGPGAVFWMWVIALLGAATAFVESTLAQLFKVRGKDSFVGGPAYYILKGTGRRWWAVTFAVLITVTFGLAFNSVQSNTIADAFHNSFGIDTLYTAIILTIATLAIICGGIQRIARFSEVVVPVMAIAYILLALVIVVINIGRLPGVFALIVESAFGVGPAASGAVGMAIVWGMKRGLFSNEAGEGSTPNAAATATVSHPVKQGLIQALGVFTDTIVICTATAMIILCSGVWDSGANGIVLTQRAIDSNLAPVGLASAGSTFVCIAILFFAFTSIVANYYYGEANLLFIKDSRTVIYIYRAVVGVMVFVGGVVSLDLVWSFADITMALMTLCNLAALFVLGKYALRCLEDYRRQRLLGHNPVYKSSTIPEIADKTECWG